MIFYKPESEEKLPPYFSFFSLLLAPVALQVLFGDGKHNDFLIYGNLKMLFVRNIF